MLQSISTRDLSTYNQNYGTSNVEPQSFATRMTATSQIALDMPSVTTHVAGPVDIAAGLISASGVTLDPHPSISTALPLPIAMYDGIYRVGAGTIYRNDTRPPEIVKKEGFSGTLGTDHLFATFEDKTVFASRTKEGAAIFRESAQKAGIAKKFYLYAVDTSNIKTLSVKENYEADPDGIAKYIIDRQFQNRFDEFSKMMRYQRLGESGFKDYLANKYNKTDPMEVFVKTDEIHIEGPIQAERITLVQDFD